MKGIWFDDVHSYNDLNLVLSKPDIPPATAKENFVDIPGGDGSVDLTEALGEVKFKDRKCSFAFTVFPTDDFEEKKKEVSNLLNGKRCKIRLDKDPNYYWLGRCAVNNYESDKNLHKIVVGATVAPYKYKLDETVVTVDLAQEAHTNLAKTVDLDIKSGTLNQYNTLIAYTSTDCHSYKRLIPGEKYTVSFDVSADSTLTRTYIGEYFFGYDIFHLTPGIRNSFTATFRGVPKDAALLKADQTGTINISNVKVEKGETATGYTPAPEDDGVTIEPITKTITLSNGRKSVCPTIVCTGETTITTETSTFTFGIGTHKNLAFQLVKGEITVDVCGHHTVMFRYQEGDL